MSQTIPQNFQNHARLLPPYHFVALPLLLVNALYALYQVIMHFSSASVFAFLLAVALLIVGLFARVMVLTVQDRVIRLEERLRMRDLLPADLQPHINAFTVEQLVGLRFASDEELPALARKVLDGRIDDRKTIKQMVTTWRADHQRA